MSEKGLPRCGLYRTTVAIGAIPAGRLVSFHDHGSPGPGVYPPERWSGNRAVFARRGVPLADPLQAHTLLPLPAEGIYLVEEAFTCCEKGCRTFARDQLLQLGYDGAGRGILFEPRVRQSGLSLLFPATGQVVSDDRLGKLRRVRVPSGTGDEEAAHARVRSDEGGGGALH